VVFRTLALLWLVAVAAAYARALHSPSTPALPARRGRLFVALELVSTNVALTLLLAEGCLQALAACGGPSLLLSNSLDAHRLTPGHDYGAGLRGNALGYPGPDAAPVKRPGLVRIVALGDSFAVGPAVPFAENYLTRLQATLPGVEVCNLGISGAGPREYRAALTRDGWPLQPDLVLVSVFVGNDITETLPTPRYMDPRRHALYLLCERGWRLAWERARQPAPQPGEPTARLEAPPLTEETFRAIEARRLAVCLAPPSAALEKKWRRALGHLGALVGDCQARHVPIAFVLIPDEFQVNPAVLNRTVADAHVERGAVDLDLPQRRLQESCDAGGVPCLDLRPALQAEPEPYAVRDTHWNVRGNRAAAAAIAHWLSTRLPR
jgi:hypothetical protein